MGLSGREGGGEGRKKQEVEVHVHVVRKKDTAYGGLR